MRTPTLGRLLALIVFALVGCRGRIQGVTNPTPPALVPGPTATAVPIARLTVSAYTNTLNDLFPGITLPPPQLPADPVVGGFDNVSAAQAVTADLIDALQANAEAVAIAAVAQPQVLLPCHPATAADEEGCGQQFLTAFGQRAFRRPMSADETQRAFAAFHDMYASYGFSMALQLMIEGILQSPNFLYRVEFGTPTATPNLVLLNSHELASRLSYFLWSTMPDPTLMSTADNGTLLDPASLEAQARRMLTDPRAHAAVAHFHYQLLEMGVIPGMTKDPTLFPAFNASVAAAMLDSTQRFAEHAFWDEGTLDAFFTDSHVYVDQTLAPFYGLTSTSSTMELVAADPAQRSGVLTQAGLLAGLGHPTRESPVLRGVFVLRSVLCEPPPPPPPNVNTTPPSYDGGAPVTTRQQYADEHEQGICASCHHTIDGVGFGFEHYDSVGSWRDQEAGLPVDASGWITNTSDINGPFDGMVSLSHQMATSQQVQHCVVSKWMEFALGLDPTAMPPSVVLPVANTFAQSHDFQDLLLAVVKSDAFTQRVVTP